MTVEKPAWVTVACSLAQRGVGLALVIVALMGAQDLPLVGDAVFATGAAYLLALVLFQRLWLLVLPLLCVLIDLAPWTGRFIYNELDVFFWLTVAAALICARYRLPAWEEWSSLQRLGFVLIVTYLVLTLATARGLSAITSPPGAAFDNPYLVPEYGYKVLKGLLWGALLTPLWFELRAQDPRRTLLVLFSGASLAALALLGVILWERGTVGAFAEGPVALWASLSDMGTYYRTIGLFSDMHTGGEALDGTIIVLLSLNLYAAVYGGSTLVRGVALSACIALVYVTLVGFTRATYAAFALTLSLAVAFELFRRRRLWRLSVPRCLGCASLLPLFFLTSYGTALELLPLPWWLLLAVQAFLIAALMPSQLHGRWGATAWGVAALLGVPLVFALGLTTESMGRRMVGMEHDLDTRWEHWERVLQLGTRTPARVLIGHGAGSFPVLYQASYAEDTEWIGSFSVNAENNYLEIRGGGDLMLYQRLPPGTEQFRVRLSARARGGGELSVAICARNILDTGWWGGRCDRKSIVLGEDEEFAEHVVALAAPREALSGEAVGWPLALHIRALSESQLIELESVEALPGSPILRNGEFRRGLDHWFFSTDFGHLPFHIKNIWLQFWFDHGVAGLLNMLALVTLLAWRLVRGTDVSATVAMSGVAILAMSALGLFGTPLDSARMGWWFYLLLFLGLLEPELQPACARRRVPGAPGLD